MRLTVAPVNEMSDFTLPYLNLATTNSIQVNWKTSKKPAKAIVLYGGEATSVSFALNAAPGIYVLYTDNFAHKFVVR